MDARSGWSKRTPNPSGQSSAESRVRKPCSAMIKIGFDFWGNWVKFVRPHNFGSCM